MFGLEKLFRSQKQQLEEKQDNMDILECPFCHSQKVAVRFIDTAPDAAEKSRIGRETGRCIIIESGKIQKECQECGYTWGEEEFKETLFIMPKRTIFTKKMRDIILSPDDFFMNIDEQDDNKVIMFTNKSREFVEVVFTIDGKEVKEGKTYHDKVRGYAYPPNMSKAVKKTKDGKYLPFHPRGGVIKAYVFPGEGSYLETDLDTPAFQRGEFIKKVKFTRTSAMPAFYLEVKY